MMTFKTTEYEYAGFKFIIEHDDGGVVTSCVAATGQHPAAYKDKHARAARECFADDFKSPPDHPSGGAQ